MGELLAKSAEDFASVNKTTSGLVVVPEDSSLVAMSEIRIEHTVNRARSVCIQCTQCTQMCPRHLLGHPLEPHRVMRMLAHSGDIEKLCGTDSARQALICCECGVCEIFACPMGLQPRRVNALVKKTLSRNGARFSRTQIMYSARPELDFRKVPTNRIAARAGVLEYDDVVDIEVREYIPERLVLNLRQGIGDPAVPVVHVGEKIAKGNLIAKCPDGKLGSNIHSGLDGIVSRIDSHIVIEKGRE